MLLKLQKFAILWMKWWFLKIILVVIAFMEKDCIFQDENNNVTCVESQKADNNSKFEKVYNDTDHNSHNVCIATSLCINAGTFQSDEVSDDGIIQLDHNYSSPRECCHQISCCCCFSCDLKKM
jgi:hypothetical protein